MSISTKDALRNFYSAYAAWLDSGATGGDFLRNAGLCANLYDYCEHLGIDTSPALTMLHFEFMFAGLDSVLPFNSGPRDYAMEKKRNACYLNQHRTSWVRAHAAGIGKGE